MDWKLFAVSQRNKRTGCIPTGYEMLLRAAKIDIDYSDFQERFDLAVRGGINCFTSVANAIESRYPFIRFNIKEFDNGADKLAFIEQTAPKNLLLVSLANPGGGWHIMPVINVKSKYITLLQGMLTEQKPLFRSLPKSELVYLHDHVDGGKDVAYLNVS